MVVPPNGWFTMVNTIKMDDFGGTPISGTPHIVKQVFEKIQPRLWANKGASGSQSSQQAHDQHLRENRGTSGMFLETFIRGVFWGSWEKMLQPVRSI